MKSQTIHFRGMLALAALVFIAGCANFPIHSETRDKQGQAVKKAWSEVDIKGRITTARENLTTLLGRELATEDKLSVTKRDQLIRSMATGGSVQTRLVEPINKSLAALVGGKLQAEAWLAATSDESEISRQLAVATNELTAVGLEMPSCSDIDKPQTLAVFKQHIENGGLRGGAAKAGHHKASSLCKDPKRTATSLVQVDGAIKATLDELKAANVALEAERSNLLNVRNAYRAALDAHDHAVSALKVDPKAREKVAKAAKEVEEYVKQLSDAQDNFSVKFLSDERKLSLDRFLAAVAGTKAGEPPPEGASKAAVALILFPDLVDQTAQSLVDAKKPTLVPLVLRKQYEQIRSDAAGRGIAAQEATVAIIRHKLEVQTRRVEKYLMAGNGLAAVDEKFLRMTPVAVMSKVENSLPDAESDRHLKPGASKMGDLEQRKTILRAAGEYLDAETRMKGEVGKLEYRQMSTKHERALALAESNALQWEALIGSAVDQLTDYGAAGIKPEMIVALLNSLTLLWIGIGVN